MSDRFEAEQILRAAASDAIPNEGDVLLRFNEGWRFAPPTESASGTDFTDMTGQIGDTQVTLTSVKQFEAFLAIAFTQLTGQIADGQVPASAVLQWCDEILKCEPFNLILARSVGEIADDRISASSILQWVDEILKTPIFSMILARSIGRIEDDRISASAVTQFCDEILKCEPFNFILKRATSRRPWSVNHRLNANGALA